MLQKKIIFILISLLLYQTPLQSKSNSFNKINSKNLSKYFSGIVAYNNKNNLEALKFFNSSKILINKHDPYLKRYINSLVLDNKVSHAINVIKNNKYKNNSNFFEAYLLLILDSLKKNDFDDANNQLKKLANFERLDRFNLAISESLKQYIYVFRKKKNFR